MQSAMREERNQMSKKQKSNEEKLNEIVTEARSLRQSKEEADARFLLYLRRVEAEQMSLLEACGIGTFAQFLKSHDLCDVARFENFKKGVGLVGEEEAERLGANPVIALANTRDRDRVPAFVRAVDAFSDARGGVRPSLQASQRLLRQVDPRQEVPRDVGRLTEIDRLTRENAQLRTQVARLTRENAKLKKELEKKAA